MSEDWYKSRTPRNAGYTARECRIALPPHLWEVFDRKARILEWSRSKLASSLVYISLNGELLREQMGLPPFDLDEKEPPQVLEAGT